MAGLDDVAGRGGALWWMWLRCGEERGSGAWRQVCGEGLRAYLNVAVMKQVLLINEVAS